MRICRIFFVALVVTASAALFAPSANAATFTLAVTKNSGGSVASSPFGINCGFDCSQSYTAGTVVTLTATPTAGKTFSGWSGACSGNALTCTVKMDAARTVNAAFASPVTHKLTVTKSGSGQVVSSPAGISCGFDCTESYAPNTVVTLSAKPNAGYVVSGWSGACSGRELTCLVTMDAAKSAGVTFVAGRLYQLTVTNQGAGRVTSAPAGVDCGTDCTETYVGGTNVTLTAAPAVGWTFKGWSGACSGNNVTCPVTMDSAKNAAATFEVAGSAILTVEVTRFYGGDGTVTSEPAGIDCGADCSESYAAGTSVTLTATPRADSYFHDWGQNQGCADVYASTCTVTIEQARTVSAHFGKIHVLNVAKSGTGTGTVTSVPSGIDCGSDCTEGYDDEDWHENRSQVDLTATPDPGSYFVGWSGFCSGAGPCSFSMDGSAGIPNPVDVTAVFESLPANSVALNVVLDAEWQCWDGYYYCWTTDGIVTSEPAGIDCRIDEYGAQFGSCRMFVSKGSVVTLSGRTDYPDYYRFDGWSGGGCSGTGPCAVTVDENTTVTAAFRVGP